MEKIIKILRIVAVITLVLFLIVKFVIANTILEKLFSGISISCFVILIIIFCSNSIRKYYLK